jgi:hypothetical protein
VDAAHALSHSFIGYTEKLLSSRVHSLTEPNIMIYNDKGSTLSIVQLLQLAPGNCGSPLVSEAPHSSLAAPGFEFIPLTLDHLVAGRWSVKSEHFPFAMDKGSDKSRWGSMATSARKLFRSNSGNTDMEPKSEIAPETSSNFEQPRSSKRVSDSYASSLDISLRGPEPTPRLSDCSIRSSLSIPGSQSHLLRHQVELTDMDSNMNSLTQHAGDRKRTLMRYVAAVEELKSALKLGRPGWEKFEFPEFDVIPESDGSLALLQEAIDEKLNASKDLGDINIWQKGKKMAERLFVALSPFAKNFLTVAKGASQSVCTIS